MRRSSAGERPSRAPGFDRCLARSDPTTPADRLGEALGIARPILDRVARHVPLSWELRARADGTVTTVQHRTRWSQWRGVLLCGGARDIAVAERRGTFHGEALYATANGRLIVVRYSGAWRNETLTLRASTRLLGRALAAQRFSIPACVAALDELHRASDPLEAAEHWLRGPSEQAPPVASSDSLGTPGS